MSSADYGPDDLVGGGTGAGTGRGVTTDGGVAGLGVTLPPPVPAPELPPVVGVAFDVGAGVTVATVPDFFTIAPGGGVCPGFR